MGMIIRIKMNNNKVFTGYFTDVTPFCLGRCCHLIANDSHLLLYYTEENALSIEYPKNTLLNQMWKNIRGNYCKI